MRGDRFFDFKDDYQGQVTFFASEVVDQLKQHLNIPDIAPSGLRRNISTTEVDLNSLIGQEFEVQGVRLLGTRECTPCYWMDQAFAPGAEKFLQGQGSLRAKVLTSGTLSLTPILAQV